MNLVNRIRHGSFCLMFWVHMAAGAEEKAPLPPPMVCPPPTVLDVAVYERTGIRTEACVDAHGKKQGAYRATRLADGTLEQEETYVDGRPHGVRRVYDSAGRLTSHYLYERGAEKSFRLTKQGLQEMADKANKTAEEKEQRWRVSFDGEETIVYELTGSTTLSKGQADSLVLDYFGYACRLKSSVLQIKAFEVRLFAENRDVLQRLRVDTLNACDQLDEGGKVSCSVVSPGSKGFAACQYVRSSR
jgi:hypothetical protein